MRARHLLNSCLALYTAGALAQPSSMIGQRQVVASAAPSGVVANGTLRTATGRFIDVSDTLGDLPFSGAVRALEMADDGTLYAAIGDLNGPTGIARWDNTAWNTLGAPLNVGSGDLKLGPDDTVFLSGYPVSVPSGIYRWDGSAWSPIRDAGSSAMMVASDGTLYASARQGIERWDDSTWSSLGNPIAGNTRALALASDGTLYAGGGYFDYPPPVQGGSVARRDGTGWSISQTNAYVFALALGPNDTLYAGGWFVTVDGVAARGIARWDGTTWSPLGSGVDNQVWALAVAPDGTLYAGGRFSTAGDGMANNIARWDGTSWTSLGTGVNGDVEALAIDPDGNLYVGGTFTVADGIASPYIALWDVDGIVDTEPAPAPIAALTIAPNPTHGPATAWTDITGDATVTVHDALGRLIATPFAGTMAGRTAVRLPEGLPPGVYVVRLVAGDAVQTARLVVVR